MRQPTNHGGNMKKFLITLSALLIFLSIAVHSQSWTAMTLPDIPGKFTLTDIQFPNATSGWAVGYIYDEGFFSANVKGIILHYADGRWQLCDFPAPSENWTLHGVCFLNTDEGWAYGQNKVSSAGIMLHFKHGKWETVDLEFVKRKEWVIYDAFFFNSNEGYAVGSSWGNDKPILLHYKDGAWKPEMVDGFEKQTLLAVHGITPGILCTGGFREGEFGRTGISRALGSYVLLKSKDTWEPAKFPMLSRNIICRDIVCLSEKEIIGVGWMPAFQSTPESGKIIQYNGSKWSEMDAGVDAKEWNLMGLAFESPDKGWAVGNYPARNKGLLLEYNKGKWTPLGKKTEPQVSDKWMLRNICYDGSGNYYAVGSDEKVDKGLIIKLTR